MKKGLEKRLAALEALQAPPSTHWPVFMLAKSSADAERQRAELERRYGPRRGHSPLFVMFLSDTAAARP